VKETKTGKMQSLKVNKSHYELLSMFSAGILLSTIALIVAWFILFSPVLSMCHNDQGAMRANPLSCLARFIESPYAVAVFGLLITAVALSALRHFKAPPVMTSDALIDRFCISLVLLTVYFLSIIFMTGAVSLSTLICILGGVIDFH
jgi:hypothetical protein